MDKWYLPPEQAGTGRGASWQEIKALLWRLGATPDYRGYWQLGHALYLAAERPEVLTLVDKWLYAQVAQDFHTSKQSVERNMRTLIRRIWEDDPQRAAQLTGLPPAKRPSNAKFLSALVLYLETGASVKE